MTWPMIGYQGLPERNHTEAILSRTKSTMPARGIHKPRGKLSEDHSESTTPSSLFEARQAGKLMLVRPASAEGKESKS